MRIFRITIIALSVSLFSDAMGAVHSPIDRGVELYNDGRWIDAKLNLLKVKDDILGVNNPDLEMVDYYLAKCEIELNESAAEVYLVEFERKYPGSIYLNDLRFAKALLYCSNEKYNEAKELFQSVNYSALSCEEREKYNIRMGYISFLEKDYAESRGYMSLIDAKSSIYHHALYYTSYIDYIQGFNDSARVGFKDLLHSDAYAAIAPFYLLQIEFKDGAYDKVLSDGEAIYDSATAFHKLELDRSMAEAAFRIENYNAAIGYIRRYELAGGEMGREENYISGFSRYRDVQYDAAIPRLRAACGADDALTQNASYHLADCYLRLGKKNLALSSFAMASNDMYDAEIAEDALFNYAKLQFELGDDKFNETINTLARYINTYPNSGRRYEQAKELLIASYYNSRNYDAAYKSINELKNPDADIRLALQRITLYRALESYNRGEYSLAESQMAESLHVNISPKYNSIARFYLGEIEFARGDYQSALRNYNAYFVAAPKSDANYAMALYNLAYTKLMLEDEGESMGYYQRFVESSPTDNLYRADAYNRLGDIFYSKRQFAEATDYYKKAMWSKFEPRYYASYQSAIIDGIEGDYSAKIKRLNGIITIGDGGYVEPAMYELGRTYVATGSYKSGVEMYERFLVKYPSSDKYAMVLSDLGLAYLNLGDKSTALTYYDKAIKKAPQSAVAKDALQGVREIYINDGDADGYFKYASSVGHSGDIDNMMRDSLSFASAQRLYINGEGRSMAAVNSLTDYVKDYPHGYYATDALFYLGDSYTKLGKNRDAITAFNQLIKRGQSQYIERAYSELSTLNFAELQYKESAESALKLHKTTQRGELKSKALSIYADATILSKDNKQIVKMADYVVSQSNVDAKLLVKVKHAKALILYNNNDKETALLIFKDLSSDLASAEGAESLYYLIEYEFENHNYDVAEQMIFDFAESNTPQAYHLARAFILLGDIYVSRGDNFQARATYQSIIDGYTGENDGIVELVKTKIDKLP